MVGTRADQIGRKRSRLDAMDYGRTTDQVTAAVGADEE